MHARKHENMHASQHEVAMQTGRIPAARQSCLHPALAAAQASMVAHAPQPFSSCQACASLLRAEERQLRATSEGCKAVHAGAQVCGEGCGEQVRCCLIWELQARGDEEHLTAVWVWVLGLR